MSKKEKTKKKSRNPRARRVSKAAKAGLTGRKRGTSWSPPKPKIRVVGIGGGGGSIIAELAGILTQVDFVAANTDKQALAALPSKVKKFQFGEDLTAGLGAGMNPKAGERAAKEAREQIKGIFSDKDFCILVACLGGGTGSGAGPVFAEISRELRNVNLGIFTLPFEFEGEQRIKIAERSLARFKQTLNALMVVSNEKIFQVISQETALGGAFSAINKLLAKGLQGLIETILKSSLINIDFADLKTILRYQKLTKKRKKPKMGALAYLHSAELSGADRAQRALSDALCHPLQDYNIQGAERILFNISGNKELKMAEVEEISASISDFNKKAKIIFGLSHVPELKDKLRITILTTKEEEAQPREKKRLNKTNLSNGSKKTSQESKPKPKPKPKATPVRGFKDGKETQGKQSSSGAKSDKQARAARPDKAVEPGQEQKEQIKQEKSLAKESVSSSERDDGLGEQREKIRRNALQLKKEAEEMEKDIIRQEEIWDTPAFLRKKNNEAKQGSPAPQ